MMEDVNQAEVTRAQRAELLKLGERLLQQIRDIAESPSAARPPLVAERDLASLAKEILRFRRWRDANFDKLSEHLFADPAWDVLLDLFVAGEERRSVSVSSACIAASVPPTTALRWLNRLESEGLIERTADRVDGRRVNLRLSLRARELMAEVLKGRQTRWEGGG